MMESTSQQSCSRPRVRPPSPSIPSNGPPFGARDVNTRYGQVQNGGGRLFRHEFFLDSDQTAIVIGRGGGSIQRIEVESGARLRMHRESLLDGMKCLEITAESVECLESAKLAVKTRLEGCCRPIVDNGSSVSGDRASPSAPHSNSSAVRADLPPVFMRQNGTGGRGRGGGAGYVNGLSGGRSMGYHPPTAQHQSRLVNRDDVEAREGGGGGGRAPMPKVEPQIFHSLDVPCEKSALLKEIDYPALQNQLGVRIRQSVMAPPRPSRLTISGSKGKVEEAKQYLESLLHDFALVASPDVVMGEEAVSKVTFLPRNAGSSNSSDSESANEVDRCGNFDRGTNGAPRDVDNEPKLDGAGGAERERKGIDSGCEVEHLSSPVAARMAKAVHRLKKELKSLHVEVRELKEMDSFSARTAELASVMKELAGLEIEVGKLKDKQNKPIGQPICEECGVELCQVIAKTGERLVFSTKCQDCNSKEN